MPTTVVLTVAPDAENSAPQWCGVERCLVEWPTPEVARGGTVTVPVLPGWVDPEGDPLLLLGVENPSGKGSVAATPARRGRLPAQRRRRRRRAARRADRHDRRHDAAQVVQKPLVGAGVPQPLLTVQSFALVDTVGGGITVDVAPHVTGHQRVAVARLRPRARRRRGDRDDRRWHHDVRLRRRRRPGTFRVDFTVTDGAERCHRAPPASRCCPHDAPAAARDRSGRRVRASAGGRDPRCLRRGLEPDASRPAAQRRRRPGRSTGPPCRWTPWARTSCGSRAPPRRARPDGWARSRYVDQRRHRRRRAPACEGEATVYLLPPAPELAPIAVDDTVVVRAGAQIDIPVLENDISPAGGRPTLEPGVGRLLDARRARVRLRRPAALPRARRAGRVHDRLLRVHDGRSAAGRHRDGARARPRRRRQPRPAPRDARGPGAERPVDAPSSSTGSAWTRTATSVTLDRIVSQPERGSATISADGTRSSTPACPVTAARCRSGTGSSTPSARPAREPFASACWTGSPTRARSPSPTTCRCRRATGNSIRVSPLSNDVDPTLGSLTHHRRAARPARDPRRRQPRTTSTPGSRTGSSSADDTTVVVDAGVEPATMSFLYDIESSSGNTGRGLIVVEVVRESVPDYPVVADTVLTAETREDFPRGVDVLADKATWSGGDVADLSVALWGEPPGVDRRRRRAPRRAPRDDPRDPVRRDRRGLGGRGHHLRASFASPATTTSRWRSSRGDIARGDGTRIRHLRHGRPRREAARRAHRGRRRRRGPPVREPTRCATVESGTVVRYDSGAGAPVARRVSGSGADGGAGRLDLPVGPDHGSSPRPAAGAARRRRMTVGPGETTTFDLQQR